MQLRQNKPLAKKIRFANNFAAVQTVDELKALVDTLYSEDKIIGFDIETGYHGADFPGRSLDMYNANQFIAGFSITNDTTWARYVPVHHDFANNIDPNIAWELVKPLLEDKVGVAHNILFEATNLRQLDVKGYGPRIDIPISKWHDSMIQAYILSDVTPMRINGDIYDGDYVYRYVPEHLRKDNGYQDPEHVSFTSGLKSLTKFRYNYSQAEIFTLFNGGKELTAKQKKMIRFNPLPIDPKVVHYACDDAYLCLQLHRDQYEAIMNDAYLPNVYRLEMQIADVLADMNEVGVSVDWEGISSNKETFDKFSHSLKVLTKKKFEEETGQDQSNLNFNSPAQMSKLIYGAKEEGGLGMEVVSTTKKGAPSTDDKALTSIRRLSPAVDSLLKYRQCNKMGEWFYLWDSLKDRSWDKKIHPNFIQTRIQSGRFASADPNCVQGDVEVLTPKGWVRFDELEDGVEVAQVSTDGAVSFVVPESVIRKQFSGEGVRIHTPGRIRWTDLWMTPNHRILSYNQDGIPLFEPASSWLGSQGEATLANRYLSTGGDVLGGISLTVEERSVLEEAVHTKFKIGRRETSSDEDPRIYHWLNEDNSFRTEAILSLSKEDLDFFMLQVDKWCDLGSFKAHHQDTPLFQAVAAMTGRTTRIFVGDSSEDVLLVVNSFLPTDNLSVSSEEYDGMVYCVTVPTSAFLVRSNGTVLVTGNCQNLTKRWWFQTTAGTTPDVMASGTFGVEYWTGNARDYIVASPDYKILSFDYKSAEIQFLAALAQETEIIEAFRNGEDFHKWTASLVFAKPISEVTKKERQAAKAQPLTEPILTPHGWVKMGDLKVGDEVIGSDGKPTKVVGISPRWNKEIYKVTTSDGETRCTEDHLWTVRYYDHRHPWKTVPLSELIKKGTRTGYHSGNVGQYRWELPDRPVVEYAPREEPLPVDPYILGLILGDGGLTHDWAPTFCSADPELITAVTEYHESLGGRVENRKRGDENFWVLYLACAKDSEDSGSKRNPLRSRINSLGLNNANHKTKFVPDMYLRTTPGERLAILQGLLDTDGTPLNSGAEFVSTSKALAEAVVELARSLGGRATLYDLGIPPMLEGSLGSSKSPTWKVYLRLPEELSPFRLSRKAALVKTPGRPIHSRIRSVEKIGVEECQCIKVENEDGLYVTNDFIVTHNTISFASVYGSGIPNMAKQLGITVSEMQDIYNKYFARFPKLAKYFEDQHQLVQETNEVRTWLGRRAVIWESMHPDRGVTNKAERMSVNIPVQGGATGDYTKMAMVRVANKLKEEGLWMTKVRMLMNQHDSLVFEVHDSLNMEEIIDMITPQVQFDLTGIQGCYNQFDAFPPMSVDWEVGVKWGSVADADKAEYLFANELVVELKDNCPTSILKAVTDVLSTNPGDVPVTLKSMGNEIKTKFKVKSHPDIIGKILHGDPDLGIESHGSEFVDAEFRI